MKDNAVRRLPVIDGHELIGIVAIGDIAKSADEDDVGKLLEAISAAPAND
jgi:CBS domain-containing protein